MGIEENLTGLKNTINDILKDIVENEEKETETDDTISLDMFMKDLIKFQTSRIKKNFEDNDDGMDRNHQPK